MDIEMPDTPAARVVEIGIDIESADPREGARALTTGHRHHETLAPRAESIVPRLPLRPQAFNEGIAVGQAVREETGKTVRQPVVDWTYGHREVAHAALYLPQDHARKSRPQCGSRQRRATCRAPTSRMLRSTSELRNDA